MANPIEKTESARIARGHLLSGPTAADARQRHERMKAWYIPRDVLVRSFQDMVDLKNPYDNKSKAGVEDSGYILPSERISFSTATFPFDAVTLGISQYETKHPYATCYPSYPAMTETQRLGFERYCNGVLDMQMLRSNFLQEAGKELMTSGWLVTSFPFDNNLKKQGKLPFDIHYRNVLGFYPMLNHRQEMLWCSVEERIMGADLIDSYSDFPFVQELIDAESEPLPGSPAGEDYHRDGHNIYTTEFVVGRYYDDTYTYMWLQAGSYSLDGDGAAVFHPVGAAARNNNRALAAFAAKGKPASLLHSGKDSDPYNQDDPFYGVLEHKMGRIPFDICWCWPEARNMSSLDYNNWAGRYVGLPFLYSQMPNWRDMSRLLSQFHTIMLQQADPQIITNSKTADVTQKIVRVDDDEKVAPIPPPQVPEMGMQLMQMMQKSVYEGLYSAAEYGARAGTSGSQQGQVMDAGGIRQNVINKAIEQSCIKFLRGTGEIMMARGGDEKVQIWGKGLKYQTGAYSEDYAIGKMESLPIVDVNLNEKRGILNPERAGIFKSFHGLLSTRYLLEQVLEHPRPDQILEDTLKEQLGQTPPVMGPQADLAGLQKQAEIEPAKRKAQEALDKQQAISEWEIQKKLIEDDLANMSEDEANERNKKHLEQLQKGAGLPPDQKLMPPPGPPQGVTPPPGGPPPHMGPPPPSGPPPGMGGPPPPPMPPPMMPPHPGGPPPPPMMMHMGGSVPMPTPPRPMPFSPPGMGSRGMPMPPPGMPPPGMMPPHMGPPMPPPGLPPSLAGIPPHIPIVGPGGPPPPHFGPPIKRPIKRMPSPMPTHFGPPPHLPGAGLPQGYAKAPGQADRVFQPNAASQGPGGPNRPGVPSMLSPAAGLPGGLPHSLQAVNAALQPPRIAPITNSVATAAHMPGRRTRRGRRGGG